MSCNSIKRLINAILHQTYGGLGDFQTEMQVCLYLIWVSTRCAWWLDVESRCISCVMINHRQKLVKLSSFTLFTQGNGSLCKTGVGGMQASTLWLSVLICYQEGKFWLGVDFSFEKKVEKSNILVFLQIQKYLEKPKQFLLNCNCKIRRFRWQEMLHILIFYILHIVTPIEFFINHCQWIT